MSVNPKICINDALVAFNLEIRFLDSDYLIELFKLIRKSEKE